MKRDSRNKNLMGKSSTDKIILYAEIGVISLAVIVFALFMYSKGLSDDVKNSTMTLEQMANIANSTQNTESASTEIGKTVEESQNEINTTNSLNNSSATNSTNVNNTNTNNKTNTTNIASEKNTTKSINTTQSNSNNSINSNTQSNTNTSTIANNQNNKVEETKKDLVFTKPVEGEIVREYAKENLIYSETLKEWTTHMGIDIKAEKTTVVKSAEAGTIKSIKSDPRYGLTIVIEHENNFQTIYSNLLTSEFVVEGEKVEKGQAIGTVGNTAVFEIADEPHLHFEILKNSIQEDPSIYIK